MASWSWWSRLRHLARRLRQREAVEQDLADEVRSFFEIRVEQGRARGLSEAEARRAAAPALEGPAQVVQRVREGRVGVALDTTWQDLRYAWRGLKGSPGFTLFAVATIALCLGANAAIFTLVDGLLLKPSGYPEPERNRAALGEPARGRAQPDRARQLPGLGRAEPVLRGDGRPGQRQHGPRRRQGPAAPGGPRLGALLRGVRGRGRAGPHLRARRGPARPRAGGGAEPPALADALRQRPEPDRPEHPAQSAPLHGRRRAAPRGGLRSARHGSPTSRSPSPGPRRATTTT